MLATILIVIALVLLLLVACGVSHPKINLLALGLFCWLLAEHIGRLVP